VISRLRFNANRKVFMVYVILSDMCYAAPLLSVVNAQCNVAECTVYAFVRVREMQLFRKTNISAFSNVEKVLHSVLDISYEVCVDCAQCYAEMLKLFGHIHDSQCLVYT